MNVAQCRACSHLPLLLYLPSIDAWALDTITVSSEEVQEGQAAGAGQAGSGPTPSRNAQPSITPLKSYPASISPFRSLLPLCATSCILSLFFCVQVLPYITLCWIPVDCECGCCHRVLVGRHGTAICLPGPTRHSTQAIDIF